MTLSLYPPRWLITYHPPSHVRLPRDIYNHEPVIVRLGSTDYDGHIVRVVPNGEMLISYYDPRFDLRVERWFRRKHLTVIA